MGWGMRDVLVRTDSLPKRMQIHLKDINEKGPSRKELPIGKEVSLRLRYQKERDRLLGNIVEDKGAASPKAVNGTAAPTPAAKQIVEDSEKKEEAKDEEEDDEDDGVGPKDLKEEEEEDADGKDDDGDEDHGDDEEDDENGKDK